MKVDTVEAFLRVDVLHISGQLPNHQVSPADRASKALTKPYRCRGGDNTARFIVYVLPMGVVRGEEQGRLRKVILKLWIRRRCEVDPVET